MMAWGRVNYGEIFIFGWTIPLLSVTIPLFCDQAVGLFSAVNLLWMCCFCMSCCRPQGKGCCLPCVMGFGRVSVQSRGELSVFLISLRERMDGVPLTGRRFNEWFSRSLAYMLGLFLSISYLFISSLCLLVSNLVVPLLFSLLSYPLSCFFLWERLYHSTFFCAKHFVSSGCLTARCNEPVPLPTGAYFTVVQARQSR